MEQEIDLRPYFRALVRYWWLILLAAVLGGTLAYLLDLWVMGKHYYATALVIVTEPRQTVTFDPRIEETQLRFQQLRAVPELAMSDGLLQRFMAELPEGEFETILALRNALDAEIGNDGNIIRLTASDRDAEFAASLANRWAALVVEHANRLYGTQSSENLKFYETQKAASAQQVEAAEQALVDFQVRNTFNSLDNQLTALKELQIDYLTGQSNIRTAMDSINGLLNLLRQSTDPTVTYTDQLTLLSLQLKAFNLEGYIPFLLTNEAGGPLTVADRAVQISALEQLTATLTSLDAQIGTALVEMEPQILQVQQLRERADRENRRLLRERDVAVETYTTLSRRVDQERITSADTSVGVNLASEAAVPIKPALPLGRIAIMAGTVGGLVLGVILAYMLNQRQRPVVAQAKTRPG